MLRALQNTAEQVKGAEPVSAHPPKIRDQLEENNAVIEDLETRGEAFEAVKRAADDVINKAGNRADPAVKGMNTMNPVKMGHRVIPQNKEIYTI